MINIKIHILDIIGLIVYLIGAVIIFQMSGVDWKSMLAIFLIVVGARMPYWRNK